MLSSALLEEFIRLADGAPIDAYDDAGAARKKRFHQLGRRALLALASTLDLEPGSFDIRSNMGGIAISGEITLHGEWLYVQFGQNIGNLGFMYRRCIGRKDYRGQQNQWMPYGDLRNWNAAVQRMLRLQPAVA